jgi:hypothetical protein
VPLLDNPQHEAFAQAVAKGTEYRVAYGQCFPSASRKTACRQASRVAAKPLVRARITELQAKSATSLTLTMAERREFLARVVRADFNNLDLSKDGDLIQEKIITETKKSTRTTVKLPGKRECIMDDARLAGEMPEEGSGVVVNVGVTVTVLPEDRRAKIMDERQRLLAEAGE